VDGRIPWANLHLLFWPSLIPFGTSWLGNASFAPGRWRFTAPISFSPPSRPPRGGRSAPEQAGSTRRIYAAAIPLAFANSLAAYGCHVAVAVSWLIPDRRIDKRVSG
jgi:hypothetical protein